MVWRVASGDDYLKIDLGLQDPQNKFAFISTSALQILGNLANAIVLESCPHDSSTTLPQADPFSVYVGPLLPLIGKKRTRMIGCKSSQWTKAQISGCLHLVQPFAMLSCEEMFAYHVVWMFVEDTIILY